MSVNVFNHLSDDVVQKILLSLDVLELIQMSCKSRRILNLLCSPIVWNRKKVAVSRDRHAKMILEQPHILSCIRHFDFDNSQVDIKLVSQLIRMVDRLESISFKNADLELDDDLICGLVKQHGHSLKHLAVDRSYRLTNVSIEYISQYCTQLSSLSLYACMFSDSAISMLSESPFVLKIKKLNLGRCHLINFSQIHHFLMRFKNLKSVSFAYNDSVSLLDLMHLLSGLQKIVAIDVTDCVEMCKKDIRRLQEERPCLNIIHSSKIEDNSPASIRAYLMSFMTQ